MNTENGSSASSSSELPWEEETLEKVFRITETNVKVWCEVINKIGLTKEERKEWITIFIKRITDQYQNMIQQVTNFQNLVFDEIETLLKKSASLCKNLHIKMPVYGSENLSLYEEKDILKERIAVYELMFENRKKEVTELLKREHRLCSELGRKTREIQLSPLPTSETIVKFKTYLETLESEVLIRQQKFSMMKSWIIKLVEELDYEPMLDFEKTVVFSDELLFPVTDENMQKLENFSESLKQQLQETKEEILHLREKIKVLWELLAEDLKQCDEFLQKHTGNSLNTLKALQSEAKRCEGLKRANIKVFVKRMRQELVVLWNKCHLKKEQSTFEYFYTDLYTEDLLKLHDMEIEKLKQHYEENSELFSLLEKHEELWAKAGALYEKAAVPGRYHNRGGQLLKEERERNALSKRIPQIEERLLQLADDYEARTGKAFLSWGETVEAIISTTREKWDYEKKLKLCAQKQKRDKTPTPGKSKLGLTPCVSSQNFAVLGKNIGCQKKRPITPLTASKRQRLLNVENEIQNEPPKITVNGRTVGPSRFSLERAKRIKKCLHISQKMMQKRLGKENGLEDSSEYNVFEKEIQNKENCRSTIVQDAGTSGTPPAAVLSLTPHRQQAVAPKTPYRTPRMVTKRHITPRSAKAALSAASSCKLLF